MSAMKGEAGAVSRRACLVSLSAGPAAWLAAPQAAHAGGQLEEPLIDSVRTALSSAVLNQAPPEPQFGTTEARLHYLRWLGTMSDRLRRRKPDWEVRRDFLQTVWYESKRAGLDVSLVLGLVQVESAFRKFAVSSVGARGYMQVMPFWTRVIGDGDPGKLFHMQTNLRFGCVILRHYLDRERGDLFMTLGRYNGSRGRPQYPDAVFAAQRNWVFQDRITTAAEGLAPAGG
ncbi:lytic transglycosylase domain-containing protein [Acidovorax sp. SUPP950]|uniref:lytic transglycosylase domain-containing protein n=1 Tax=unclassified Acidovorax TaxID=2684926 RepID=UPI0023C46267|nr:MULTISPECIES: lytic transglycosylase domain-containing protein [Comamonadaceae]WOI46073.1 lytic transglycosylase domain-containing protein [Paracidovorax avenae]GKS74613.1 lytic transglycosylase domain-containing protein [Acidovorax sp. SUPP950]GKS88131.1 lytic transglycosylase domain-containing protein [Acidovorax sp. SUPP2539]